VVQVVVGEVVCGGEDAGVGGCRYGHFGRSLVYSSLWVSGLEGNVVVLLEGKRQSLGAYYRDATKNEQRLVLDTILGRLITCRLPHGEGDVKAHLSLGTPPERVDRLPWACQGGQQG
jgi:hypothetical protein